MAERERELHAVLRTLVLLLFLCCHYTLFPMFTLDITLGLLGRSLVSPAARGACFFCCVLTIFLFFHYDYDSHCNFGICPWRTHLSSYLSFFLAGHIERTVFRGLDLQALHAKLKAEWVTKSREREREKRSIP